MLFLETDKIDTIQSATKADTVLSKCDTEHKIAFGTIVIKVVRAIQKNGMVILYVIFWEQIN